ncbi:LysM peptidoglycan-binding domain-containing protein [Cnuibacter sp. UC19_7]|uniref:LysM peptidoglycan-binding domain-containing protein n=1 Tax=Cnuibacter sp. UC19_7 TaxID=3350166 RepID=UPI00366DAC4E
MSTTTATAGAPARVRLRITRRGQVVLASIIGLALALTLGLVALFGGGSATATGSAGSDDFSYVTVHAGQSLWAIAEDLAPGDDPREVIASIRNLNGLSGSEVQPGQKLAVPQQYAD